MNQWNSVIAVLAALTLPVGRAAAEAPDPSAGMLPGYTDGKYRNPAGILAYGLSGLFEDAEWNYIRGLNERMRVQSLMDGRRFLYEVVKLYADADD